MCARRLDHRAYQSLIGETISISLADSRGDEALDAWVVENSATAIIIGEQVADWST